MHNLPDQIRLLVLPSCYPASNCSQELTLKRKARNPIMHLTSWAILYMAQEESSLAAIGLSDSPRLQMKLRCSLAARSLKSSNRDKPITRKPSSQVCCWQSVCLLFLICT